MTISYGNAINNPVAEGGGGGEGASTAMEVSVSTGGFQIITGNNVQSALGQVDAKLALNEDYDSILLSLDPLETDIGAISQVPLQSLQTQMHDGRPSHKASGSIVYDEFGTYGVIDTIEGQIANVATLTKAGGGAGVANAIKDQNKGGAIYDWVGTKAEHEAQKVSTNHPDWICYITDDVTSGASSGGANTSLDNITSEGKQLIASMGMPSDKSVTLTLSKSPTWYTVPADGYIFASSKTLENITIAGRIMAQIAKIGGWTRGFSVVAKGESIPIYYSGTVTSGDVKFVYAEGSK